MSVVPVESIDGFEYFVTFIIPKFRAFLAAADGIPVGKCDNGGEYGDIYATSEFVTFCRERGIKLRRILTDTSSQSGVADRMNRTLLDKERSMHARAAQTERFESSSIWLSCSLSSYRKLDSKTKITVFVGYPNELSGYRLCDPETQKLLVTLRLTRVYCIRISLRLRLLYLPLRLHRISILTLAEFILQNKMLQNPQQPPM
ncbi:hypothetical protein V1509DRAFT_667947 [Lipomyces kononenkoae]